MRVSLSLLPTRMPTYDVSETHFFRQTGRKVEAGGTVELSEAEAAACNDAHPGLLKPSRLDTQARPAAVRRGRKPRARG